MFEPRSNIERTLDRFAYLPEMLGKAAGMNDRLERFKLVITMVVAGMHIQAN
jgi:hypothetical protein